jgi:hypothetical protein
MLPLGTNQTICDIVVYLVVENKWFSLDKADLGSLPLEINFVKTTSTDGDEPIAEA